MKEVDEQSNGRSLRLSVGETFLIRLNENRTTGFRWELKSKGAPACELADSVETESSGRVGEGGVHAWKFQAAKQGEATIKLQYHRPWEKDKPPERTFTLHVSVSG
ncbi:MAG TPA: protease inhibitor I42 family protein [Pyrinomonadaceae bacterium]|nr:protease inhibitor I42 family protein [Pyrinomonadaceae bacterium]